MIEGASKSQCGQSDEVNNENYSLQDFHTTYQTTDLLRQRGDALLHTQTEGPQLVNFIRAGLEFVSGHIGAHLLWACCSGND